MGRESKYYGYGVDIPWVGGKYLMGSGDKLLWVEWSKYHG
jgi:hypothetical protein